MYLVGAGPGDPGLITLRAWDCLQRADVVLYDYLVNPRIVRLTPPQALRLCLGQHGSQDRWSQAKINEHLIRYAQEGKTVVRLKGGDPMVFGRAAEELDALTQQGIPFEIVPGVTAGLAAASYLGIPITERHRASAIALVTGQQDPSKSDSTIDYAALARFPGTLVIYMAVTTVQTWSRELLAAGKPADTPVAAVRRATYPDQQTILCRLDEVAERLSPRSKFPPPAVCIIGPVAEAAARFPWFEGRPLVGRTVLITRPEHQAGEMESALTELGAQILIQPAIEIRDPADWGPVDRALGQLELYDWVVFSSANGVRKMLDRLRALGRDARSFHRAQIAAIGPATAAVLSEYQLVPDQVPGEYRAEALADALAQQASGKRFLLVRASRGRDVLARTLAQAGALVEQVVCYESVDVEQPDREIADTMASGHIDYVTVTSSAIARSLVRMFGSLLQHAALVSISPVTSQTLREAGWPPAAEASEYTMQGVIDAIVQLEATKQH